MAISAWILLELRPPLATFLWILLIAALPVGGPGIFLLLGARRIRRSRWQRSLAERRAHASSGGPLAPADASRGEALAALEPRFRQLLELGAHNSEASITTGNLVRVLRNGSQCFPAIEEAITRARHHVHLEYYIIEEDQTGTRLRDLLASRASEGVQVRLLTDAFGTGLSRRFLAPLRAAGVEVEAFNRMRLLRLAAPGANFRSHRKIVVCDGDVAFTGGLNIGDAYAGIGPERPIRDTHVRIEGPAARDLQIIFLEDWHRACGRTIADAALFGTGARPGGELVQIVASGADRRWHALHQLYFAAINCAQRSVRISTPYFVPDEALLAALVSAALRGVTVELLLPRRSDSIVVSAAGRSYYDELLLAGVRIFEYLPGFLHAKSLVVDGLCSTIGTANLNRRSFNTDFEVNAFFYSPAIASELEEMFVEDLARAERCSLESRLNTSFPRRLAEAGAHLLAPIL